MKAELLQDQKKHLAKCLYGKTIMVSGGTGLIGSSIVRYLFDLNDNYNAKVHIVVLYRDEVKRKKVYDKEHADTSFLQYNEIDGVLGDVHVDYIIHAAGISGGSKMHLSTPTKIFTVGINGTKLLLDYAISHGCERFCYVSTYEIYGSVNSENLINENHPCNLDPMVLRNSYAEVKRVCEAMLTAYSAEYNINVYSGRLTSTFGTGVSYNDPRFFAEFARCFIEGKNIVLKSTGGTIRNYLDADDAASAFLFILVNGENNNAYNLTNIENAISIKDLAERFIRLSDEKIDLVFDIAEDVKALGFRKEGCTIMDDSKLKAIGWMPIYTLDETIEKMIESMKKESCR